MIHKKDYVEYEIKEKFFLFSIYTARQKSLSTLKKLILCLLLGK